jgi:hypothetical protein
LLDEHVDDFGEFGQTDVVEQGVTSIQEGSDPAGLEVFDHPLVFSGADRQVVASSHRWDSDHAALDLVSIIDRWHVF